MPPAAQMQFFSLIMSFILAAKVSESDKTGMSNVLQNCYTSTNLAVSTFSRRERSLSICDFRIRKVIRQSISYDCSTISGDSSLTILITSFINGYSKATVTCSSTVFRLHELRPVPVPQQYDMLRSIRLFPV